MGILSGIASIGGDFISKAIDYDVARRLQHDSQDFTYKMFANRHQMEVKDLIAAGLNPILSANSGGGSPGSGIASTGSMDNPAITSATMAKLEADTEKANSDALYNRNSAEYVNQQKAESLSRQKLVDEERRSASAKAQIDEIEAFRKKREFDAIDKNSKSQAALGIVEALPTPLRPFGRLGVWSASALGEKLQSVVRQWGEQKQKDDIARDVIRKNEDNNKSAQKMIDSAIGKVKGYRKMMYPEPDVADPASVPRK